MFPSPANTCGLNFLVVLEHVTDWGIQPQHFSLLTCLTLVSGLRWTVRSLAPD